MSEHSYHGATSRCPMQITQTPQLALGNRKEGNVLFNDALNTFYLRIYGVRHMVKGHSDSEKGNPCHHIGYSFRLTARVLLYAPSHIQDSTYHGLCYTWVTDNVQTSVLSGLFRAAVQAPASVSAGCPGRLVPTRWIPTSVNSQTAALKHTNSPLVK